METFKRVLKTFFEPLTNPNTAMRWTILVIVILAVLMAFATRAEAAHKDGEQPPTMHQQPKKPADLFSMESHPDEYCIALNIYFESRADSLAGKYAVADVVLNRRDDPRFPNTVCDVIYQAVMYESWKTQQHKDLPDEERIYYPKRHMCQFSWFCDGKPDETPNQEAWRESQIIAYNIIQFGRFRGITEGATHYHATYVDPWWNEAYDLNGQIGAHIFYKWAQSGGKPEKPTKDHPNIFSE